MIKLRIASTQIHPARSARAWGQLALGALTVLCFSASPAAAATWAVAEGSEIAFVSVKDDAIPVGGKFTDIEGEVDIKAATASGAFRIALDSLDSGNPGRDQNIQQIFFQVASKGTVAEFRLESIQGPLDRLGKTPETFAIQGQLSLAGVTAPVNFEVVAMPAGKRALRLVTRVPVPIRFDDFGLGEATEILKKVCGHKELLELAAVSLDLRLRRH